MEGGKHQNQEAPVRRSASPSEIIQIEALYGPLGLKRALRRSAAVTKAGGGRLNPEPRDETPNKKVVSCLG